mmetsp:Transcript_92082/g.259542  ORF Transcript_92082/g.259542 Transcript_92082/m.259542 type:complete len:206 (+) Transcript_92082:934-1551(+)
MLLPWLFTKPLTPPGSSVTRILPRKKPRCEKTVIPPAESPATKCVWPPCSTMSIAVSTRASPPNGLAGNLNAHASFGASTKLLGSRYSSLCSAVPFSPRPTPAEKPTLASTFRLCTRMRLVLSVVSTRGESCDFDTNKRSMVTPWACPNSKFSSNGLPSKSKTESSDELSTIASNASPEALPSCTSTNAWCATSRCLATVRAKRK